MLPGKDKLNAIKVMISKFLTDLHISHNDFVSINSMLREYNESKEEIKNIETSVNYTNKYYWYKEKAYEKMV